MGKWLVSLFALAWLVLISSPSYSQIKYSQRGFFIFDYKVGKNSSKFDRNFRADESTDFGTTRGRFWNDFRLGEWARATWMFEADYRLGQVGGKTGSGQATTSLFEPRGDIVNIETGELWLDVMVPFTDFHLRGGQLPFFTIFPVVQERTPGFHLLRPAGWIRPNILFLPIQKTTGGAIFRDQFKDDYAGGAWVDILPQKGISIRPLFFFRLINDEGPVKDPNAGDTFEYDQDQWWLGVDANYDSPTWFGNTYVAFMWGERDYDTEVAGLRKDQDMFGSAAEAQVGYRWGANTFSLNYFYRSGNRARKSSFVRGTVDRAYAAKTAGSGLTATGTDRPVLSGDLNGYDSIVTLAQNKNVQTQLYGTRFQHPSFDLEIGQMEGPFNQIDAGWHMISAWWNRKLTRTTDLELGFSALSTAEEIDNDGDLKGDSRHVGEAFDIIFRYTPTRGLSFNTGTAWLIPGKALDRPKGSGVIGSKDAQHIWAAFVSTIFRF